MTADETVAAICGKYPELKIEVRGPLTPGLSGATVFLVSFEESGTRRLGVLKLTSPEKALREVQGDKQARETWLKGYLPDYLIQLSIDQEEHREDALLISLAKDRLENCLTLRSALESSYPYARDCILSSIALAYREQAEGAWSDSVLQPLRLHFHNPLDVELLPAWQDKWQANGFPGKEFSTITFENRLERWPNPVAYFVRAELWDNFRPGQINVPWIIAHGDLNAQNILCPTVQRATALGITAKNLSPYKILEHLSMIDMPFCRKAPYTYDVAFLITWLNFLLPSFDNHIGRDLTVKAYEAVFTEIATENESVQVSAQATKYVECVSLVFRQMIYAQPKMAEDIKQAWLASLAAASLWQAIRVGSKDELTTEKRNEVLRLLTFSSLALKQLFGDDFLQSQPRNDFELRCDGNLSRTRLWTAGSSKVGEFLSSSMNRPSLVLVLGRAWNEYGQCPEDGELLKLLSGSPEELLTAMNTQPTAEHLTLLQSLAKLPLLAVFDWSVYPYPRTAIQEALSGARFIRPVVVGEPEPAWNEKDAVFYFHLRGYLQNRSTVAIRAPDRSRTRERLAGSVAQLCSHHSSNLTILYVGFKEGEIAETHEFLYRFWEQSAEYVCVSEDLSSASDNYLKEWNIRVIEARISEFLAACDDIPQEEQQNAMALASHRLLVADMQLDPDGSLVAGQGTTLTVDLSDEDANAVSRAGQLIYEADRKNFGVTTRDPREFFIGNRIEFPEVHQGVLVQRTPEYHEYLSAIEAKLEARHLSTVIIPSKPGAGASTVLRWLAYTMSYERNIPTLILSRDNATVMTAFEAIERIYRLVGRSFLVVADPQDIAADVLQSVRMRCAPSRYPVVFVTSVRAIRPDAIHELPLLKLELNATERKELLLRFSTFCPTVDVAKLYSSSTQSLFLLTLEAFGSAYTGVNKMVKNLLQDAEKQQAFLLAVIAFFARYAHKDCTNEFLQIITGRSYNSILENLEAYDQLLLLANEDGWACRHDQLSKAILQYYLTEKFDENEYRYELANFLCKLLDDIADPKVGREIVSEYVWAVLNPQLEAERGPSGERPQQSRLIGGEDGLPENAMRYRVFDKAASMFDDHVNILAHFGKYLSEKERKWSEAERFLMKAYSLDTKSEVLAHMIGKRYYDETLAILDGESPKSRSEESTEKINLLSNTAHDWFGKARSRNLSSEFVYTTPIQLNIRLIRDEFKKLGITSATDDQNILLSNNVATLFSEADILVAEGQRYIEPVKESRRVFEVARDTLHQLRGDLATAIRCFEQHVRSSHGLSQTRARVQLARLLLERAERSVRMGDRSKAQKDFAEGERQLYDVLQDPAQRVKNIKLWFDCARHVGHWKRPDFLQRLHQLHERVPESLDANFLLACLYFCEAIETGSPESWRRYEEFRRKSAILSSNLAIRRYVREWLVSTSFTVSGLVTKEYRVFPSYLFEPIAGREMPRSKTAEDSRTRLQGRISRVDSPTEGYILIEPMGFELFFQPRVTERQFYKSDAERRTQVLFYVQFTYEKPQAFGVERMNAT